MTKSELVEAIQEKTGIAKKDISKVMDAAIETVTDTLMDGDKVSLVGFGTFQVSNRKARTGQNPQTGEKIEIPARRVPKFTPGKTLKDKIH